MNHDLIERTLTDSSYMDCLNSWGFWEKRAELEIKIANLRSNIRSPRTVYLSCNFCGKSVSNVLQEDARIRSVSSNVNKVLLGDTYIRDIDLFWKLIHILSAIVLPQLSQTTASLLPMFIAYGHNTKCLSSGRRSPGKSELAIETILQMVFMVPDLSSWWPH